MNDASAPANLSRLAKRAAQGSVKELSPVIIYLSQPDVRETIRRIAEERVSDYGKDWLTLCIEYCENSSFGKQNFIVGLDGALEMFRVRKQVEMEALARLSAPHVVIDNPSYDWDGVWADIVACLQGLDWGG